MADTAAGECTEGVARESGQGIRAQTEGWAQDCAEPMAGLAGEDRRRGSGGRRRWVGR